MSTWYLQLPCEILIGSESSGKAAPVLCSSVRHSSKASGLIVVQRGDLFLYFTLPKSKGRFLVFVVFFFFFCKSASFNSMKCNGLEDNSRQEPSVFCLVHSEFTGYSILHKGSAQYPLRPMSSWHHTLLQSFCEKPHFLWRGHYRLLWLESHNYETTDSKEYKQLKATFFLFPLERSKTAIFHVGFVCWFVCCCCFSQSRIAQKCDSNVGIEGLCYPMKL